MASTIIQPNFDDLNKHYEKVKEKIISKNSEKILNEFKKKIFEINNQEKKLNGCFCKECLDIYLNLSLNVISLLKQLLTQDYSSNSIYTALLESRYFTCSRIVLVLKRYKITDDRFIQLLKKFESEVEAVRITNKQNIKATFEKENLMNLLERKDYKSKRIKIIGWSLLGLLSSLGLIVILYYYRKKYLKK